MAKPSEIQVKRLISLFEPITESQPEQKQRRASLQNILQEQGEIHPKQDDSSTNEVTVRHVARVASELPHHKGKATNDKEETTAQPTSTNVSSEDMLKPGHLDKHKRLKELKDLLKLSTNENDRLRSELNAVNKKLESVENAFETFRKEHKLQVEEPVKHEALDETVKPVQNANADELRSAKEESTKDKQARIVMEKRLKLANNKILDLTKKLKERDKELLAYKTDNENLKKAQEDLKEERRTRSELSGQLSEANEKDTKPIQHLDSVSDKTSEFDVNQKRQNKPDFDLEIHERDTKLFVRHVQGRKKPLPRPSIKMGLQVKSLDFDIETQFEADLEKLESNIGKEILDSGPLYSLPFPDLADVSHPIPNLYSGFNRPRRQKRHSVRSSVGKLARSEELVVVYI